MPILSRLPLLVLQPPQRETHKSTASGPPATAFAMALMLPSAIQQNLQQSSPQVAAHSVSFEGGVLLRALLNEEYRAQGPSPYRCPSHVPQFSCFALPDQSLAAKARPTAWSSARTTGRTEGVTLHATHQGVSYSPLCGEGWALANIELDWADVNYCALAVCRSAQSSLRKWTAYGPPSTTRSSTT